MGESGGLLVGEAVWLKVEELRMVASCNVISVL